MTTDRRGAAITPRELALFLAAGMALRILWLLLVHAWTDPIFLGEATNEALAFARQGMIADAYFPGQGPTAHLLPTMIVVAGTIEWLFGPESAAANMALGLWALLQVAIGFVLTTALFRRLGADRATLLAGLALLCLFPIHVASEAGDFRVWEGALAYDAAAANLLWIVTLGRRTAIGTRDLVLAAALAAAAFFINPPAGLAACACWAVFALTRMPFRQTVRFAMLSALAMAVLLVPWTLRNQAVLDYPIMLRSNFGLELAIANYEGALHPPSIRAADARIRVVNESEQRFRKAGGEVAYARQVGAEAERWIAAHPLDFVRLSLRHYRQFYVPDTWAEIATNWNGANRFRIRSFQVIGVLGLLGLVVGLARRRRNYGLLALYIAVAGLPYALVQPIPRYSYIVYPLLVFLTVQLVTDLLPRRRAARAAR